MKNIEFQLKVGGIYLNSLKEEIVIVKEKKEDTYPFADQYGNIYTSRGYVWDYGKEDLIGEVKLPINEDRPVANKKNKAKKLEAEPSLMVSKKAYDKLQAMYDNLKVKYHVLSIQVVIYEMGRNEK